MGLEGNGLVVGMINLPYQINGFQYCIMGFVNCEDDKKNRDNRRKSFAGSSGQGVVSRVEPMLCLQNKILLSVLGILS